MSKLKTLISLLAIGSCNLVFAETVINAAHFTSADSSSSKSFYKYVDEINKRGEGEVKIVIKGGPEIIPQNRLGEALKSGLIDMINNPAGLMLNLVPEGEVFSATNYTPEELRKNGGWDYINDIFEKKANAKVLLHIDSGTGFNFFTKENPISDNTLNWDNLKIRTSPLQKDFAELLGAQTVIQPTNEIYTSLERGVVNANVFTVINYTSYGWDRFTKYRIEPSFYQADVLVAINKKKWDSLSEKAKNILLEESIKYESSSREENKKMTAEEAKTMENNGQIVINLEGNDLKKYKELETKSSWDRIMKKTNNDQRLKDLFLKNEN